MCRSNRQVYSATSAAPAAAHQFLVDHLETELAGSMALDDGVLTVTELVTNAVNAGSGSIVVEVDLHRDHLIVAVTDGAPGLPEVQALSALSTHGRGLRIVDALSRSWGTDHQASGKRVWAELSVDWSGAWDCGLPYETARSVESEDGSSLPCQRVSRRRFRPEAARPGKLYQPSRSRVGPDVLRLLTTPGHRGPTVQVDGVVTLVVDGELAASTDRVLGWAPRCWRLHRGVGAFICHNRADTLHRMRLVA